MKRRRPSAEAPWTGDLETDFRVRQILLAGLAAADRGDGWFTPDAVGFEEETANRRRGNPSKIGPAFVAAGKLGLAERLPGPIPGTVLAVDSVRFTRSATVTCLWRLTAEGERQARYLAGQPAPPVPPMLRQTKASLGNRTGGPA